MNNCEEPGCIHYAAMYCRWCMTYLCSHHQKGHEHNSPKDGDWSEAIRADMED